MPPMAAPLEQLRTALADRYRIERELGQGGMATVYLAEDLKHHRQVAIKVLEPDSRPSLGPERFLREIEIAARLHTSAHPAAVRLGRGGRIALLRHALRRRGSRCATGSTREKQLPLEDALQIAREVADALSYAHSRGRGPPRHQAGEHPAGERARGGGGLRHRAGDRGGRGGDAHGDGDGGGHAGVHEPGAGGGSAGPGRPLATSTPWAACCTRCWRGSRRSRGRRPRVWCTSI